MIDRAALGALLLGVPAGALWLVDELAGWWRRRRAARRRRARRGYISTFGGPRP